MIEAHIDRIHGEPHDLDAFYVGPMQTAARALAGADHDQAVADAGRVWGLLQVGRGDEGRALRSAANRGLGSLPPVVFPAVAHAALRTTGQSEAGKRLTLTLATLRGRI